MNLGLGNLAELKAQLLGADLINESAYDPVIVAIGKGVAGAFDKHCNRSFARVVGEEWICPADRDHLIVPRYPLESVSKIELKADADSAWEELTGVILNYYRDGNIFLAGDQGPYYAQLRVTYTGGYWFDDSEDGSGIIPEGATELPGDVKLAWFLQARHIWEKIDKTGVNLVKPQERLTLDGIELLPEVKGTLQNHIRFAIT